MKLISWWPTSNFYPRPLRGGRQEITKAAYWFAKFLSTPSARRATACRSCCCCSPDISIHALCEEGDVETRGEECFQNISIHALCEEGDERGSGVRHRQREFLSTPSARRATGRERDRGAYQGDFYPRPLRGGRLQDIPLVPLIDDISIHALCEEGDAKRSASLWSVMRFLSTPSARRATMGITLRPL